jgi:hypothetical protein
MESVDMLQRAVTIIEREMKGGASMLQLKDATSLTDALGALVQASAISSADGQKLTALVQSAATEDDTGAPAGSVYESHSGDVIATLTKLLEQAEDQLANARNKETENVNNFEMLRQSIDDELKVGNKQMSKAKRDLASSGEAKATASGNLDVTKKELATDIEAKADLHRACMAKAENFEAETNSRGEELKALAEAKKVIKATTSGADDISYGFSQQPSFAQLAVAKSRISSGADLAKYQAVRFIRDLARRQKSPALAQLAQRMESAMHSSAGSADPFAKIKGLIRDMIDKMEAEASADAAEKAWCDRNLADARQSKAEKTAEIEKLSTRIDDMSARSAQLKEEVAALQHSLAELAKAQTEMDRLRVEEHEAFVSNKADMEKGLEGVQKALKVLTEYYSGGDKSHSAATGAGDGIIGLLEVVESDFSKELAEINSNEESAVASYEQETKENEIEKTTKDQDVKYKTKESKELDKTVSELSSDRSTVETELDAVNGYLAKLEGRCVAKAETYAERKARFQDEIAGLKQALQILQDETALVQRHSYRRRFLRG